MIQYQYFTVRPMHFPLLPNLSKSIGCTIRYTHYFLTKSTVNKSLYYPTNAHNVKNVELLKHIKIMEAAAKCFDL